jgi:hypothetical protein
MSIGIGLPKLRYAGRDQVASGDSPDSLYVALPHSRSLPSPSRGGGAGRAPRSVRGALSGGRIGAPKKLHCHYDLTGEGEPLAGLQARGTNDFDVDDFVANGTNAIDGFGTKHHVATELSGRGFI